MDEKGALKCWQVAHSWLSASSQDPMADKVYIGCIPTPYRGLNTSLYIGWVPVYRDWTQVNMSQVQYSIPIHRCTACIDLYSIPMELVFGLYSMPIWCGHTIERCWNLYRLAFNLYWLVYDPYRPVSNLYRLVFNPPIDQYTTSIDLYSIHIL